MTPEQLEACRAAVRAHGWSWKAALEGARALGVTLPSSQGCWEDLEAAGLLPSVLEVAAVEPGLQTLHLVDVTLPKGTQLPSGLQTLHLVGGALPEGTQLPSGLRELHLVDGTLPEGTQLPSGLRELSLEGGTLPKGTQLPSECALVVSS